LQADDLPEVARAKAAAVRRVRGWVLVEDAGLFVPSLGGFPGVYSAHFLKLWGFGPLLELLRRRHRAAEFRSVAVLRRGSEVRLFVGRVTGAIARRPAGRGGFGFDPIFIPRGYDRTFAELPASTKNALSHRARSMGQVGRYLAGRGRDGRARRRRRPRR
jgi:XTP/dITP diphosphohydrolase